MLVPDISDKGYGSSRAKVDLTEELIVLRLRA